MLPFWRLEPPFRFAIYIAFAVLFASGAEPQYGWPVLSWFNSGLNGQGRPLAGLGPRGGFN